MAIEVHLRELEEQLLANGTSLDSAQLDELLSDNFFEFGSSGKVWMKKDFLLDGLGPRHLALSEFQCHEFGPDVYLVTYRIVNQQTQMVTLRSSIWKQTEGKWRLFFHQGTPVPSS